MSDTYDVVDPRSSTALPVDVEINLELFRQAQANGRSHMDLRGKHFSAFLLISGVLLAVSLGAEPPVTWGAIFFGLVATALYRLMDRRMEHHQKRYLAIARTYEKRLGAEREALPSLPRSIGANTISRLIFGSVALLWLALLVANVLDRIGLVDLASVRF